MLPNASYDDEPKLHHAERLGGAQLVPDVVQPADRARVLSRRS